MQITFKQSNKAIVVPVEALPAEVKLYKVPKSYSEDGYFAAVYMPQVVLEPIPACATKGAELLAHIRIIEQDGKPYLSALSSKKGVTYAAS
jgi:hypothetical protein